MANYLVGGDSAVAEVAAFMPLELTFDASAAGVKHVLIPAYRAMAPRVWFITGNGTIDISSAEATDIVERSDGSALDLEKVNLRTGLMTYLTNIPAAANGEFCLAFAVGGLPFSRIAKAEVIVVNKSSTVAANPARIIHNVSSYVQLNTVALSGGNALLKDDGVTAIAYGTDTLVTVPKHSIVFGAVAVTFSGDAPAAADDVSLRLWLK